MTEYCTNVIKDYLPSPPSPLLPPLTSLPSSPSPLLPPFSLPSPPSPLLPPFSSLLSPLSLSPSLPSFLPLPPFLTQEIDIVIEFMYSGGLHLAIDADLVGLSQYITSVAWYITNTVFVQDFAEPLQHCIYSSELSAFHILKVQSSMPSI